MLQRYWLILKNGLPDCCAVNGFHIVEHILLRPGDDDFTPLFNPVLVKDVLGVKQHLLLFKIFWLKMVTHFDNSGCAIRFPCLKNNVNAQYQFEQLVRRETPAHVLVRFCWMMPEEMYNFETAYLKWVLMKMLWNSKYKGTDRTHKTVWVER